MDSSKAKHLLKVLEISKYFESAGFSAKEAKEKAERATEKFEKMLKNMADFKRKKT